MGDFKVGSTTVTDFIIDTTAPRRLRFQYTGWSKKKKPNIVAGGVFLTVIEQGVNKSSGIYEFVVESTQDAEGTSYVADENATDDKLLKLKVGKVTNHNGMIHDMIADLGRSNSAQKVLVYQKILSDKNNAVGDRKTWDKLLKDQPLKQITDPDHPAQWNCGAALDKFGNDFFGAKHQTVGNVDYYAPMAKNGKNLKMSDIAFLDDVVADGARRIKNLLSEGTATRVFVVHHDGFSTNALGRIKPSGKTHYLTIVGCNEDATSFLAVDPWPNGSKLMYTSGLLGTIDSAFMGRLERSTRGGTLFTPAGQRGGHDYQVLSGK